MFGLFIITFVGIKFFDLAKANAKNKWIYAILGILSYCLATSIVSFILNIGRSGALKQPVVLLLVVAVSCLTSYAFYKVLQLNWAKQVV